MNLGIVKHGKLFKKWIWETQLFALTRNFQDGITFLRFNVNLDLFKSYHSPAFQIELTLLNLYFHFWIYTSSEIEIND